MSNIKERTRELLAALGMGHEEFQERCGLGGGFVSRISVMTRKASFDKIKAAFPEANINWLITGNGSMFGEEPKGDAENVGTRLHKFALSLGMNDRQFERAADLSNGYLTKASSSVTPAVRLNLSAKFPYLNIGWLLTGAGPMVTTCGSVTATVSAKDRLRHYVGGLGIGESRFLARCGLKVKAIDALPRMMPDGILRQIGNTYPTLNIDWVITGHGDMEREPEPAVRNVMYVPFVGMSAQTEYAARHTDKGFVQALPVIPVPPADGTFMAFEVAGNAMDNGRSDAYLDGDTVVCREVAKGAFIANPAQYEVKDFAFVLPGGVLVRSVKGRDATALTVTLHPLNPDGRWADTVVALGDVGKVFTVEAVIRKK